MDSRLENWSVRCLPVPSKFRGEFLESTGPRDEGRGEGRRSEIDEIKDGIIGPNFCLQTFTDWPARVPDHNGSSAWIRLCSSSHFHAVQAIIRSVVENGVPGADTAHVVEGRIPPGKGRPG
jgi:hypothetical protein